MAQQYVEDLRVNKNGSYYEYTVMRPRAEFSAEAAAAGATGPTGPTSGVCGGPSGTTDGAAAGLDAAQRHFVRIITTCHWPGTPDKLGGDVQYVVEYRRNEVGTWTAFVSVRSNAEGLAAVPRLLKKLRGAVQTYGMNISVDTLEADDYVPGWPTHHTGTYWTLRKVQDHVRSTLVDDYVTAERPAGGAIGAEASGAECACMECPSCVAAYRAAPEQPLPPRA